MFFGQYIDAGSTQVRNIWGEREKGREHSKCCQEKEIWKVDM